MHVRQGNDMTITLAVTCLAILAASVLGGIVPLATVLNHTRLQVYLSFSAGAMLGAAFFHMLPEAVRIGSAGAIPWAAAGLLALFFLERFFSFHQHEPTGEAVAHEHGGQSRHHEHCSDPRRRIAHGELASSRRCVLVGLGGLWPGGSFAGREAWLWQVAVTADFDEHHALGAAGLGVLLATLVHKPADALTISSLMVRGGSARWIMHLVNLGFGLMIPAGVALFVLGTAGIGATSVRRPCTAGRSHFLPGTFLCIALSDLLPELQFHSHDRLKLSLALLAGVALMGVTALVSH